MAQKKVWNNKDIQSSGFKDFIKNTAVLAQFCFGHSLGVLFALLLFWGFFSLRKQHDYFITKGIVKPNEPSLPGFLCDIFNHIFIKDQRTTLMSSKA